MRVSKFFLGVLVLFLTCACAIGQTLATSQVSGVIQDQTGAIVSGAHIQMTEVDTGQVHKADSSATGSYVLTDLPSGHYTLQVTSPGFETYKQRGITLDVATNPEFNVKLTVGAINVEVVVEANTSAMVETQSTGIGQVIDATQIVELPLNGRDPDSLDCARRRHHPVHRRHRHQLQQELPHDHALGRGRLAQRHRFHSGWRDP